jgi:hypothetical protein
MSIGKQIKLNLRNQSNERIPVKKNSNESVFEKIIHAAHPSIAAIKDSITDATGREKSELVRAKYLGHVEAAREMAMELLVNTSGSVRIVETKTSFNISVKKALPKLPKGSMAARLAEIDAANAKLKASVAERVKDAHAGKTAVETKAVEKVDAKKPAAKKAAVTPEQQMIANLTAAITAAIKGTAAA